MLVERCKRASADYVPAGCQLASQLASSQANDLDIRLWGAPTHRHKVRQEAEFCNHTHHFAINGKEFVHQHPVAGQFMGCAEAVDTDGAIPCQFGTWYLGRGGWCPGQDVKPYRIDVTAAVKVGGDNTLTYKGLFNGQDYVPKPNPKPQGGFGASINLRSWLVLYQ